MAKEIAISKRLKISQAEQFMLIAVFCAAAVLGVAIALIMHFVKQISFNTSVIMVEEQAVVSYSNVIKTTGVCKAPKGTIYTDEELKKCNPSDINAATLPNTLRYNVLENLAVNNALNSVTKQNDTSCIDPDTNQPYTLAKLTELQQQAQGSAEIQATSNLVKSCSALRVIPDALPAYKNEEALLASLNKIFIVSGWDPETLRPDDSEDAPVISENLHSIPVSLLVESTSGTTLRVLNNIERSIRDFNIYRATIEWGSDDTLVLQARAAAYYVDKSTVTESTVTVSGKTGKATTTKGEK